MSSQEGEVAVLGAALSIVSPVSVRIANRRQLTQVLPNGIVSLSCCICPRKDPELTLCFSTKRTDCLWYAHSDFAMIEARQLTKLSENYVHGNNCQQLRPRDDVILMRPI